MTSRLFCSTRSGRGASGLTQAFSAWLGILLLFLAASTDLLAQTFTVLHTFTGQSNDGAGPWAGVVLDSLGNLYGTTYFGGEYDVGTIFKVTSSGVETLLYSFAGSGGDAEHPEAGLVRDVNGNLVGTTQNGGKSQGGAVFRVTRSGKENVFYSFLYGPSGSKPLSDLVFDRDGNAYGTTNQGGNPNCQQFDYCGVVFKLSKSGKYTVLHSFSGPDGAYPVSGVVLDDQGSVYGTTTVGGTGPCVIFRGAGKGCGVVFKLDRKGKLTVLHSFAGGRDGQCPAGDLVRDADGNLYGTTVGNIGPQSFGCWFGPFYNAYGTVFKVDKRGKETVLHRFMNNGADGLYPHAGLVRDAEGNLYGTTLGGGSIGLGAVFKLNGNGRETVLYSLNGATDGGLPLSRLARDEKGKLYGTTLAFGDPTCSCGTVFKLSP